MRLSWLGLLVAMWAGTVRAEEEVLVFAAASTTDALQALAPAFQRETGLRVRFAFGASSDLSRQVVAGAPADAFLSADEAKLDAVERAGLVQPGSRVDLLSNRLVVIVPAASKLELEGAAGLKGLRRVVLAEPAAVPAGVYAKEWLTRTGVWKDVAPNVVPVVDVTDALQSKKVRVALDVPGAESPRIVYPAAALTQGKSPKGGLAFVRFLRTDSAWAEFQKRGFQAVRLVTPGRAAPRSVPDAGQVPDAGGARVPKGQRSP